MQLPAKKLARVDTLGLRAQLVKRLGHRRAELYFRSLKRFLGSQLGKDEFDKVCVAALGKENIKLHNLLIRSIISNACLSVGLPPSKQAATGNSQTSTVSNGPLASQVLPVRRVWPVASREKRFGDKPGPLGISSHGHPGPGEFVSAGSNALQEVISVEDGEEVDQAQVSLVCVQSRSPITAPLGLPKAQNSQPPMSCSLYVCYNSGELPDSQSLSKLLEDKLKAQGLSIPIECTDVLNFGLNAYICQMLGACLGIAKSRQNQNTLRMPHANGRALAAANGGQNQGLCPESGGCYEASLLDLWTAVQSNPQLVRCAWQREKIGSHPLNR